MSVFKIKDRLKEFITKKTITLTSATPKQNDISEYGMSNKLPQARSIIKFEKEKDNYRYYSVHQESNTIHEKIKIYKWDYLEEGIIRPAESNSIITDKGYQRIIDFNMLVDTKMGLVYVFTKKVDAKILCYRINKNEILKIESHSLDLSKINKISEIVDEWGVWLNDTGEKVKKGLFSTRIKKLVEGEEEFVTTYLVTYQHNDINIDLAISREGTISSNTKQ